MPVYFQNAEQDYEVYLGTGPAFVCNNIGFKPEEHRLHKSDCRLLSDAGPAKRGRHTTVGKWCSRDLPDLIQTLTRLYGPEGVGFQFCAFCFP